MIEGNDGGACVTFNGGRVVVDASTTSRPRSSTTCARTTSSPYRIYGSQQDNWAISLPSQSHRGAITATDWVQPGGGESGYIAVKPGDPTIVVGGSIGSGPGMGRLIHYDHRTGQERIISVWPEAYGMGDAARRASLPLPVDVPGLLLALGPARAVDRRQPRLPLGRRGAELGDREPRSHAQRSDEARPVGRADHPRQHRRRGLLHDLRAGRVAARARRALGGHRRRPRPPLARSRPDVAAGDAAGPARVGAGQRDRAVAARRGHVLRRGDALQARRHAPLPLQDERLRPHVDAHRGEPAGRRDHARRPRGPQPARTALLRHRDRRVGLARRRRRLAAAPRRTCRSRRSTTSSSRTPTWSWPRTGARSGSSTTSHRSTRWPTPSPPPTRTCSRRARPCAGARTAATA